MCQMFNQQCQSTEEERPRALVAAFCSFVVGGDDGAGSSQGKGYA